MMKKINCLKAFMGCFLILLQASHSWCDDDLSLAVVRILLGLKQICSGTLVRDIYVVTSAKCLIGQRNASALVVARNVAGRKLTVNDIAHGAEIFIPFDYSQNTGEMDIGVLKLSVPIMGPSAKLCSLESLGLGEPVTTYARLRAPKSVYTNGQHLSITDSSACAADYSRTLASSMFCVAAAAKGSCFINRGFAAAVRGQLCGVYSSIPGCTEHSQSYIFTSLANPNARQFLIKTMSQGIC